MLAIKFLNRGYRSPILDRPWPRPQGHRPGRWVTSAQLAARKKRLTPADVDACVPAVYGCLPDQIAWWLRSNAWIVELDDAVIGKTKVGARRGRLVRRVENWTPDVLRAWAYWCADRAIHIHAVAALRTAGLIAEADRLAATATIVDEATASAALGIATEIMITAAVLAVADAYDAVEAAQDAIKPVVVWADAAFASASAAARAAGGDEVAEKHLLSLRLAEMVGIIL